MNNWKKVIVLSGLCSCALSVNAFASTNLETGSSLAGISVALNNYYAGNTEPEKQLASSYSNIQNKSAQSNTAAGSAKSGSGSGQGSHNKGSGQSGSASGDAGKEKAAQETASKPKSSAYDNIAVSKINGTVNIRTEANTSSGVTGKINNDCAATILDTVDGEGGKWYKIQSGSVTGYIKADYFVTGQQAESRAKQVGTTYGTIVGTPSLRLRQSPDMEGKTLTLLSEGAHYVVTGEEGDFLKVQVDSDLEGYVFKEYMKTSVEFNKAVSVEEERAKAAEEAKRKEEADKALKALEDAKKADAAKKTTAGTTKAEKTTQAPATSAPKKEETKGTDAVTTIAANPENGMTVRLQLPQRQRRLRPWTARVRALREEPPQRWPPLPVTQWWHTQNSSWVTPMCTAGQALQAELTVPDLPRAYLPILASVREEAPGTRLPEESPYRSAMPSREICCSMPAAITLTTWLSTSAAGRLSMPAIPPRVSASHRQITGRPVRQ